MDQELARLAASRAAAEAAETAEAAEGETKAEAVATHDGTIAVGTLHERDEEAATRAEAPLEATLSSRPVTFLDFALDRRPRTRTTSSSSRPRADSRPESKLVQPPSLPPRIAAANEAIVKRDDSS